MKGAQNVKAAKGVKHIKCAKCMKAQRAWSMEDVATSSDINGEHGWE